MMTRWKPARVSLMIWRSSLTVAVTRAGKVGGSTDFALAPILEPSGRARLRVHVDQQGALLMECGARGEVHANRAFATPPFLSRQPQRARNTLPKQVRKRENSASLRRNGEVDGRARSEDIASRPGSARLYPGLERGKPKAANALRKVCRETRDGGRRSESAPGQGNRRGRQRL